MVVYTEAFARFILECRDAYEDICQRIEDGDVKAGAAAKVTIVVPPEIVDQIRFDRLAASAD